MSVVLVGDQIAKRYGQALRSLSDRKAGIIFSRALNRGGDQGRTQVRRSLVSQTGIKYGLINKAVTEIRAHPNRLEYSLVAVGDETNLSLFNARQRKKGVSAAPWKKRRIFKGTFIVPGYGGKVFRRTSKERGPIAPLFGPNIARELMKEPTVLEWHKVGPFVVARVEHELMRLFAR